MTVSTPSRKATATGNGVTTQWPYLFRIDDEAHLSVILTVIATGIEETLSPAAYSVTGIGLDAGGEVTYPLVGSPLASTHKITIVRTVPYTQNTDIFNQSGFFPLVVEGMGDALEMQIQQIAEEISRGVRQTISSSGAVIEIITSKPAGGALIFSGENLIDGPTADEISLAQGYATAAGIDADAAETSRIAAEAAAGLSAQRYARATVVDTAGSSPATAYEAGDTVDSHVLVVGDLVLRASNGGDPADGVYVVQASGAAPRATIFDAYDDLPGAAITIVDGTRAGTVWICESSLGGTLGVTNITFTLLPSSAVIVDTIASLASAQTSPAIAIVTSSGKFYRFSASNLSTEVGNDSLQTFYIAPTSDTTGASGAWVLIQSPSTIRAMDGFANSGTGVSKSLQSLALDNPASAFPRKFIPRCADFEFLRLSPAITQFERTSDGAANYMTSEYLRELVREKHALGIMETRATYSEYGAFDFTDADTTWIDLDGSAYPAANLTLSFASGASVTVGADASVFTAGDVGKYLHYGTSGAGIVVSQTGTGCVINTTVALGGAFPSTSLTSGLWGMAYATQKWHTWLTSTYPNVEAFIPLGVLLDEEEKQGGGVWVPTSRFGDVNLLNDLYTVNILSGPDPLRFGKTLTERLTRNIGLTREYAAALWAKYGHYKSFKGWFIAHEPDHIASSNNFLTSVTTTAGAYPDPVLSSYGKPIMVAAASPIDLAADTTFADAMVASGCDVWAPQDSVGPEFLFSAAGGGANTYVAGTTHTELDAHFKTWAGAAVIANSIGKTAQAKIEIWGAVENWRMGFTQATTLTLSATSGASVTATAGSGVFVVGDVGRYISSNTGGNGLITGYTSASVVTISTAATGGRAFAGSPGSGEWSLNNGYQKDYPSEWTSVQNTMYRVIPHVHSMVLYAYLGFMDSGTLSLRPAQINGGVTDWRTRAQALYTSFAAYAEGMVEKYSDQGGEITLQTRTTFLAADAASSGGASSQSLQTFYPKSAYSEIEYDCTIAATLVAATDMTRALVIGGATVRSIAEVSSTICAPQVRLRYSERPFGIAKTIFVTGSSTVAQHTLKANNTFITVREVLRS